ncbi:hypothetical protein JHK87_025131 [Glycine soja]|nr:hypothetical protein JHK87_025131 [Glycine soja]
MKVERQNRCSLAPNPDVCSYGSGGNILTKVREANTIGGIRLGRGGGGLSDHSLADPSVMGRHGGGGPDLAHQMDGVLTMVVSYL